MPKCYKRCRRYATTRSLKQRMQCWIEKLFVRQVCAGSNRGASNCGIGVARKHDERLEELRICDFANEIRSHRALLATRGVTQFFKFSTCNHLTRFAEMFEQADHRSCPHLDLIARKKRRDPSERISLPKRLPRWIGIR